MIVIVAIVVIAIVAAVVMAMRPRLHSLPDEAKGRYARSWSKIQERFIEDPRAAVREADQVATSMLRDRGAKVDDESNLPKELKDARAAVGPGGDQADTERLRKAMLSYQRIFDDSLGSAAHQPRETGRREVA